MAHLLDKALGPLLLAIHRLLPMRLLPQALAAAAAQLLLAQEGRHGTR